MSMSSFLMDLKFPNLLSSPVMTIGLPWSM
jgi:hypothetical protein